MGVGISYLSQSITYFLSRANSILRLGFAIFQKKEEYGGGQTTITGLEMINVDFAHLVDLNSTLTLNGTDVISKRSKVADLLYGSNFGKSSK